MVTMKKIIVFLLTLNCAYVFGQNNIVKKPKPKYEGAVVVKNNLKTINSKSISLPAFINEKLFQELLSEKTRYKLITDTIEINKLLTKKLKEELNVNDDHSFLLNDYNFFYIGAAKYKEFNLNIFIYKYQGIGVELTARMNICDKSGRIIDTLEIGEYILDEEVADIYTKTNCIIDKDGQITLRNESQNFSSKGKTYWTKKYFIGPTGKIFKEKEVRGDKIDSATNYIPSVFEEQQRVNNSESELGRPDNFTVAGGGKSLVGILEPQNLNTVHFDEYFDENAKVYLNVKYDAQGVVLSSSIAKGTTTSNPTIIRIAKNKIKELKFPVNTTGGGFALILLNFKAY